MSAGLAGATPWAGLFLTTVVPDSTVGGVITLAARADGLGISSVQFQVSGQNVTPEITSGPCWTLWDTRSVADGTHTVGIVARDSVGNTIVTTPVLVTVRNADTVGPEVSITPASGNATVSGLLTVTAVATDNVGVASVWFTIDDSTIGAENATAPYELIWNTESMPNGTYAIRAVARDAANNVTMSAPISVTVNNEAPSSTPPSTPPNTSPSAPPDTPPSTPPSAPPDTSPNTPPSAPPDSRTDRKRR